MHNIYFKTAAAVQVPAMDALLALAAVSLPEERQRSLSGDGGRGFFGSRGQRGDGAASPRGSSEARPQLHPCALGCEV